MDEHSACTPEEFIEMIKDCYKNQKVKHEVVVLRHKFAYRSWLEGTVDKEFRNYSKVHQFWFRRAGEGKDCGKVIMSYKLRSREPNWRDQIVVCTQPPTTEIPPSAAQDQKFVKEIDSCIRSITEALQVPVVSSQPEKHEAAWNDFLESLRIPSPVPAFEMPGKQPSLDVPEASGGNRNFTAIPFLSLPFL